MELNEYQRGALSTAIYPQDGNIAYLALALCGEAGEIADKVKKVIRDKGGCFWGDDLTALAMEVGDVLWYASTLAKVLGFDLEEIAELNLEKITDRMKRGVLHGSGDNR